jgi:hypothetical protein
LLLGFDCWNFALDFGKLHWLPTLLELRPKLQSLYVSHLRCAFHCQTKLSFCFGKVAHLVVSFPQFWLSIPFRVVAS